jgi:uncharacterized protein (DUF58 family)
MAFLFAISVPLAEVLLAIFESHYMWSLIFPFLCIFLFVADVLLGRRLKILVNYEYPTVIPIGEEGKIFVHLKADRQFSEFKPTFEVKLETIGLLSDAESPNVFGQLESPELNLIVTVRPLRRGRLFLKTLWLRWPSPLGLCVFGQKLNLAGVFIDSIQSVKGLHEAALSFFLRETEPGLKKQPFRGDGSEFDSLVDYHQGMDNRFMDWKRSARYHKLLAKDFRQERNHQIILAFDTGRLMKEPVFGLPKLDHYVRAALLMAWVGLQSGDIVGAADFALTFNAFLKPGRGSNHFSRLQRFTSGLNYSYDETNFAASLTELWHKIPHRSLIVIFTEFIDIITAEFMIEGLNLLAKKHSVIFVCTPDPLLSNLRDKPPETLRDLAGSVISDSFIRDRAIVLERVARLGIQAIDVPPKAMSSAILNRYLAIKQRGLL